MAKFINAEKTAIVYHVDGVGVLVEVGEPDWGRLSAVATGPDLPSDVVVVNEVTPDQIRLALLRARLLDKVQQLADSDPEASIVWEYATVIYRNSPFIEALKGDFTDEQIDQLFTTAAQIV